MKALERENRELRQANEILHKASAYFAQAEVDRRSKTWSPSSTIIRWTTGSSRFAKVLPIAPSNSYSYDHLVKQVGPSRSSRRAHRDAKLRPEIRRVFDATFWVSGVLKVWRQMRREGFEVARWTVARPMKEMGIESIVRGKRVRTTVPDEDPPCPLDCIKRQF